MKAKIDGELCTGHGRCCAVAPEFYQLDDNGYNADRGKTLEVPAGMQAAETAAIDRTLSYTPYVRVAGSQHREVALTFDDGPGPYTPQILSVLERDNAPATFFEVGILERYFHAATSQIVADGYPIGDHTEAHAPMSKLSPAASMCCTWRRPFLPTSPSTRMS